MAFANEFMIYPTIISLRQVEFVFKSLTKDKNPPEGKQLSMSFEEFEEALIRIAVKGGEILNQIYQAKLRATSSTINQALGKMVENSHEKTNSEAKEDQADNYDKIDQTTKNTLNGLFYFLDLPPEKQALYNKLHELKNRGASVREREQRS